MGLTDKCPEICDKYAAINTKISVIHKSNGGLSDARNTGIKAATGDYIMFLDSDDFWDNKGLLESLKHEIDIQNCDVLNFHYQYYYEDSKKKKEYFKKIDMFKMRQMDDEKRLTYLVKRNQYIASACNKVVSRKLIVDNNVYFEKGVTSEDILWCAQLALLSKRVGGANIDGVLLQTKREFYHS